MKDRSAPARARSTTRSDPAGGRLVAWAGFVFGSLTSVAANVLAARIPPAGAHPGWTPAVDAQLGAAVWPLALLLSVEALARVRWPGGFGWLLARYGGVAGVAVGSALISYGHISHVLTTWGYSELGARVGPLVIDGLMVVAGFALLAHGRPVADEAGDEAGEPVVTSFDAELLILGRKLLGADPRVGRRVAAKELGITEHAARELLAHLRQTTPEVLPAGGEAA